MTYRFLPSKHPHECLVCGVREDTLTEVAIAGGSEAGPDSGVQLCAYCIGQVKQEGLRWLRDQLLDRSQDLLSQSRWVRDRANSINIDADLLIMETIG
jgi:hypothetical protein